MLLAVFFQFLNDGELIFRPSSDLYFKSAQVILMNVQKYKINNIDGLQLIGVLLWGG